MKASSMEEDLHDLKLRFELLEGDRKAYYETSQWAMRQNKEEIGRLRKQNKEVAEAITKLKKSEVDISSNRLTMTDMEKLDHLICEMNKKYDELLAEMKVKEQKVILAKEQLNNMKREASLIKSEFQESPQAKEIRNLENRLDKAVIKYNEAQSIRKTYEQIVKRLQEERLTFDNQLSNFERALKVKKQDASDLEMMSRDANHAKEVAKTELARFEQQIAEERKHREKELLARKELVKQKMELNDRFDRKALQFDDLKDDAAAKSDARKDPVTDEKEKKIAEYEETMRLIKEATGVSDINEVIAKFQAQGETHKHLTQLQEENEAKIAQLKQKREQVLAEYEELKFSGEAKLSSSKQVVQDFVVHSSEAASKMAEAKAKCEKLTKLLANTQAGVQHLFDKLIGIHAGDGKVSTPPSSAEQGPTELLEVCVQKLDSLITGLAGKELPDTASTMAQPGEVVSILQVPASVLPAFNTRIKMRPVEFEAADSDENDEEEEDSGEVPDRESMKRHTAQMINAQSKNKQQKKIKKKKSDKDNEDDD